MTSCFAHGAVEGQSRGFGQGQGYAMFSPRPLAARLPQNEG